jgi:DNA primase
MVTKEEIEKVKELDLIDIVRDTNARYWSAHDHIKMKCLFHADGKTPSLAIYSDHYYCFACGAHGDLIEWSKKAFGQTFEEVVKTLLNYIEENKNE